MDKIKAYRCHDELEAYFLKKNDMLCVTEFADGRNNKPCWLFIKDNQFDELMKQWKVIKKEIKKIKK